MLLHGVVQQTCCQAVERLGALQKVNPGVRDDEIEFFRGQLEHFEAALEKSRLRLDAVRVIVTL